MDAHLINKAQRSIGEGSSKAASKKSARSAARKKKRSAKTQNAGQPSGPSTSSRSRSRAAVADEDEEPRRRGGEQAKGTNNCASYTVGAMHTIDIGLGLALVVYGGMVHVPAVTGAAVAYGLVLLLGALAGALGYFSQACDKKGLKASAVAGGLTVLLDISAFIAVILGWGGFIQFLNDNAEALMLTEDSVKTIQGLQALFAVIFIILAGLEAHRCLSLWGMDGTSSRGGSARSPGESRCSWFLTMCGLQKRKKTDDFVVFDDQASMESALLWSKNGAQPSSEDYLEFVPEHERGLANFTSSVGLPKPDDDRTDY